MTDDDGWYDESAGPLVRPYTITNGRTPADDERLDLSTPGRTAPLSMSSGGGPGLDMLSGARGADRAQVLRRC